MKTLNPSKEGACFFASITITFYSHVLHFSAVFKSQVIFVLCFWWHVSLYDTIVLNLFASPSKRTRTRTVPLGAMRLLWTLTLPTHNRRHTLPVFHSGSCSSFSFIVCHHHPGWPSLCTHTHAQTPSRRLCCSVPAFPLSCGECVCVLQASPWLC